jgi:hypothetical protein
MTPQQPKEFLNGEHYLGQFFIYQSQHLLKQKLFTG